jgi:hypothetical protein
LMVDTYVAAARITSSGTESRMIWLMP